ncbi:unnamed protein product [Phytophthora lilii]|uniref:Unnamed protein product n=1 Tax=Phytophthora lilii TaxID=2077276 RepID=A0A9W6TCS8_9STRA|nr:unnamed protein product [Phytophthora lilii]
MTPEELTVLSKFKHSSDMNLNLEGRKLKQAAMAAVEQFNGSAKTVAARSGNGRASTSNDRFERAQQPLSMEDMLQLQSLDSSVHDEASNAGGSESMQNRQQPVSPNGYLVQQSTRVLSPRGQ